MKVAFFGMDLFAALLSVLEDSGADIVKIFTMENDNYDRTETVQAFAAARGIPCQCTRPTEADIRALEEIGVELTVTAGYVFRIPVSAHMQQINVHPALLPIGRGAWPMPISILRGISSGVTLHKLSPRFDEGDILLARALPPAKDETLRTLEQRLGSLAAELLCEFLSDRARLWANAEKQGTGEYWEEPTDEDRTLTATDTVERAALLLRAFDGYGVLYRETDGTVLEISEARATHETRTEGEILPLADGVLAAKTVSPYFRAIRLADKAAVEALCKQYPSALSDFSFPLLFCWGRELGLSIYLEKELLVIRSADTGVYYAPVGAPLRVVQFTERLLSREGCIRYRFCDETARTFFKERFGDRAVSDISAEEDADYRLSRAVYETLGGRHLHQRRSDVRFYEGQDAAPTVEPLDRENLPEAEQISRECESGDRAAEALALRRFSALGLSGVLVRRAGVAVSFAVLSLRTEHELQCHFCKTLDRTRGAMVYLLRQCLLNAAPAVTHLNLEDDMGLEGIRRFKRSLRAEITPSYTLTLSK